ncbi:hypothetical protein SMF913_25611 [Streptomyces malaysiensis]|uniref:Uncharacterized protein n=1 Tax=Streptomyces malaysiensis TaxID=92644 RepID=A0A2J7YQ38_STRMQ|nr:hypothetical protein SMF913_25611 [Streptomyces malaysiensis]
MLSRTIDIITEPAHKGVRRGPVRFSAPP